MSWKDLDIKLKAELIKLGVLSGIRDKNKIIQMYDLSIELPTLVKKFEEGGLINTELELEQQIGLERLIQDYLVQDPTVMFGIKTLEDSYRVSEALRKFELAKLQLLIEELDIIEKEVEEFIDKSTFASPKEAVIPIMKTGNLHHLNNAEIQKLLEQSSSIINREEPVQHEESVIATDEVKNQEENIPIENKEETTIGEETNDVLNNVDLSHIHETRKEEGWDLTKLRNIAKKNTEEYVSELKEKRKREEQLRKLRGEILRQIRLDSIQKAVEDSLTKELKPNTVEALSDTLEIPIEVILNVEDTILSFTPREDSVGHRIDTTFHNWKIKHPTQFKIKEGINLDKWWEENVEDRSSEANPQGYMKETDKITYIKNKLPLDFRPYMIMLHGTSNGSDKSFINSGLGRTPDKGYHLYISNTGKVTQTMPFDKVAFHAGQGEYLENYFPASYSIGIELQAPNSNDQNQFTEALLNSAAMVVAKLSKDFNIPVELITTHMIGRENWHQEYESNFEDGVSKRNGIDSSKGAPKRDFLPDPWEHLRKEIIKRAFEYIDPTKDEVRYIKINKHDPTINRRRWYRAYGGYISNNPTLALVGKVNKFKEGGYEEDDKNKKEPLINGPLKRKKENSLEYRQALFNNVDPKNGYPSPWTAVKYYNTVVDALNSGDTSKKWETDGSIGQETAEAGWAKYLDLPYNKELFPVWNGDTVRLSPELEREIPIDTNLLKLDILEILYNRNLDRSMGIFDREEAYKTLLYTKQLALDNLRKTYKTGKWVQMNEFMGNSVNPFDWNKDYVSPLNVLLFYGLRYDKNTNSMLYGDSYDLNRYDLFLPGNPFIIRGSIPLDKKKNGGFLFPTKSLVNKVNKFREGGYEDGNENTIYTAGYSEPITVRAKKELSKRQQMQADEEWREYLKQHPIQIGSEEYNRLPERAKAQVYKNRITNAMNKAALPTAAAIIAPTALAAVGANTVPLIEGVAANWATLGPILKETGKRMLASELGYLTVSEAYKLGTNGRDLLTDTGNTLFPYIENQTVKDVLSSMANPGGWVGIPGLAMANSFKEVAKPVVTRMITGDAYTTLGGKFGYYGNTLKERAVNTIKRRLGLKTDPFHPEFLRKIDTEYLTVNKNGDIDILAGQKPDREFINFTTDRSVVSHTGGDWDYMPELIINPVEFKSHTPISIEPSDTFFRRPQNMTANPKNTTLVSGNIEELNKARSLGMETLSSRKLRSLYKKMVESSTEGKPNRRSSYRREYTKEIQRLTNKRGNPDINDYKYMEELYGLKSGVIPIEDVNISELINLYKSGLLVKYPNNSLLQRKDPEYILKRKYNKVFYDPASSVEYDYKKKMSVPQLYSDLHTLGFEQGGFIFPNLAFSHKFEK